MKRLIGIIVAVMFLSSILSAVAIEIPARDVSKIVIRGDIAVVRATSGKIFLYNKNVLVFEYTKKGYSDFLLLDSTLIFWTVTDTTTLIEYDIVTNKRIASYSIDDKLELLAVTQSKTILVVAEKRKYAIVREISALSTDIQWKKAFIPLWREKFWEYNGELYYYHHRMVYKFENDQLVPHIPIPNGWYTYTNDRIAVQEGNHILVYTLATKELLETFTYSEALKECVATYVYPGKIIGISYKKSYVIRFEGVEEKTHSERIRFVREDSFVYENDSQHLIERFAQYSISRCFSINAKLFVLLHGGRAFGSKKAILTEME